MSQLTQREAVFQAVRSALKTAFKDHAKIILSNEQRKVVSESLIKDFKAGKIALKNTPANQAKLKSPELLKTYISGLINNWLRRDPRLNGKGFNSPVQEDQAKPVKPDISKQAPVIPSKRK